jgi:hypothetical protein
MEQALARLLESNTPWWVAISIVALFVLRSAFIQVRKLDPRLVDALNRRKIINRLLPRPTRRWRSVERAQNQVSQLTDQDRERLRQLVLESLLMQEKPTSPETAVPPGDDHAVIEDTHRRWWRRLSWLRRRKAR